MPRIEIYHGSDHIVEHPELGLSNPHNDYGPGFYCTQDRTLACEWACKRGRDGFACRYELEMSGLVMLDLMDENHSVLSWIALLLQNRTFSLSAGLATDARDLLVKRYAPDTSACDLIRGYRADDSYFAYAKAFVENRLPLRELERALVLGELGEQLVLISKRAFDQLFFQEALPARASKYYPRFASRDQRARETYHDDVAKSKRYLDDVYILDILRKGGDARASI